MQCVKTALCQTWWHFPRETAIKGLPPPARWTLNGGKSHFGSTLLEKEIHVQLLDWFRNKLCLILNYFFHSVKIEKAMRIWCWKQHRRWKLRPVRGFGICTKGRYVWFLRANLTATIRSGLWWLRTPVSWTVRGIIFTSANKKWTQWSEQQIQIKSTGGYMYQVLL